MPSLSLIVLASTSTRPRPACPSPYRGTLGYSIYLLAYRLLLSCLKTYISISLHAREVDVVLTIAKYPSL
jgi:hypothetical protein